MATTAIMAITVFMAIVAIKANTDIIAITAGTGIRSGRLNKTNTVSKEMYVINAIKDFQTLCPLETMQ